VEDIMQVAYINAWENLSNFAFKSAFSTWLTRILINECLLRLKKRGKSINMNDDYMDNEINQQHASMVPTPVSTLLNSELRTLMENAISRLPEKYRVVFIMREIEGMNTAETQECLDISEANVKVRLNRAKSLLKESLAPYYKKEEVFHFHLTRCDVMVNNVMSKLTAAAAQ
jgi:RNA polymerase sigma-70 factor (ECF subfamily)